MVVFKFMIWCFDPTWNPGLTSESSRGSVPYAVLSGNVCVCACTVCTTSFTPHIFALHFTPSSFVYLSVVSDSFVPLCRSHPFSISTTECLHADVSISMSEKALVERFLAVEYRVVG